MTPAEREVELAKMHRCLDCAAEMWIAVAAAVDKSTKGGSVPIVDMTAIVERHFFIKLSTIRSDALGSIIASCVNEFNLTSCGLWELAHQLDHVLFEEDQSVFVI